jgi:surfactin synthase thioesterase subunit
VYTSENSFRPWFRSGPAASASLRLICLPYAGGGTSVFHSWHASVPGDVQVCPIDLPGRETRFNETPKEDLRAIVRELAPAMERFLDRPYALFGHSLGALIAFELARELRRHNRPAPVRFFASACRAPQLPLQHRPIHHLDDEAFLNQVAGIGDMPADGAAQEELAQSLLPALRGDFKMFEKYSYAPEEPFDFPITALCGSEDRWVGRGDLVAWHSQTSSLFNLRLLPGGHLFLRSSPDRVIRTVLESLR